MIISLTGFMGCGKSSIGRLLGTALSCNYIDLDDWIEADSGRKIPEIFANDGEKGFRKMETEALESIIEGYRVNTDGNLILSLGGGTVTVPESACLIRENTLCFYLKAGIDTLTENLTLYPGERPMLGKTDTTESLRLRVSQLMAVRAEIYENIAHICIDIDNIPYDEVVNLIIGAIRKAGRKQ